MRRSPIKTLTLIILLVLAVVLGQILGTACAGIGYLSWLGATANFGLAPVQMDLSVVKFTFGMTVKVNVAQAVLLLISIISYTRIGIKE